MSGQDNSAINVKPAGLKTATKNVSFGTKLAPDIRKKKSYIGYFKVAVSATTLRQVGHLVTIGLYFNRYITGHFYGPKVWIRTYFVT